MHGGIDGALRHSLLGIASIYRFLYSPSQLTKSGVGVEKVLPAKFAKIKSRQDALQTTFLIF
jgi:hypothetical protein